MGQARGAGQHHRPGIIITPLATDELTGPRGAGYRRMLSCPRWGGAAPRTKVATVAALLLGSDGAFITGSDVLMDGGVTAAYFYGELAYRNHSSRSSSFLSAVDRCARRSGRAERLAEGWSGMRGAVSVAASPTLGLPEA